MQPLGQHRDTPFKPSKIATLKHLGQHGQQFSLNFLFFSLMKFFFFFIKKCCPCRPKPCNPSKIATLDRASIFILVSPQCCPCRPSVALNKKRELMLSIDYEYFLFGYSPYVTPFFKGGVKQNLELPLFLSIIPNF